MERIAVTGAAGYIGSKVCNELKNTYEIVPLDNFYRGHITDIEGIKVINVDIRNFKALEKLLQVNVVIHLAAISGVEECFADPTLSYYVNVVGTENVGLICRKNAIPLIFPSSVAVLGNPAYFPIDENHPRIPLNWYGKTKQAACEALKLISEGMFPVYEFLMSNVFGEYTVSDTLVSKPNVISIFIDAAKKNKKLPVYKPGTQARNFLHIEDVAQSYLLAVKHILEEEPVYKELCIGAKDSMTVNQVAKSVLKAAKKSGYNTEISHVKNPRKETIMNHFEMDISKTKDEIEFMPRLTVEYEIEKAFRN